MNYSSVDNSVLDKLRAIVGAENWSTGESERQLHSHDQSFHAAHLPEVVVWPVEAQQVADVLRLANDANIPVTLPYEDAVVLEKVRTINSAIVHKAIELGGTATGEQGVGIGKVAYMRDEHGEVVEVMRQLKQVLDPKGILNPGKVLPE